MWACKFLYRIFFGGKLSNFLNRYQSFQVISFFQCVFQGIYLFHQIVKCIDIKLFKIFLYNPFTVCRIHTDVPSYSRYRYYVSLLFPDQSNYRYMCLTDLKVSSFGFIDFSLLAFYFLFLF